MGQKEQHWRKLPFHQWKLLCAGVRAFTQTSHYSSNLHSLSSHKPLFSTYCNRVGRSKEQFDPSTDHFFVMSTRRDRTLPRTLETSRQRSRASGPKAIILSNGISNDKYPESNGTYKYCTATAFSTSAILKMNALSNSYLSIINRN